MWWSAISPLPARALYEARLSHPPLDLLCATRHHFAPHPDHLIVRIRRGFVEDGVGLQRLKRRKAPGALLFAYVTHSRVPGMFEPGLSLNVGVMELFVNHLGVHYVYANCVAIVIVTTNNFSFHYAGKS